MSARWNVLLLLLLAAVATLWPHSPARAEDAVVEKSGRLQTGEKAILEALKKPVKLEFVETPLVDAVDYLKRYLEIEIQLDRRALGDVGIGTDTPVTIDVSGVSARSALELILDEFDLAWDVHYEVLLITLPEEVENTLTTRVYDVADLVTTEATEELLRSGHREGCPYDFDSLIELISSCIHAESWGEVGGPGSAREFMADGIQVMVVSQTREAHEEIAGVLADLRALRSAKAEKDGTAAPKKRPSKRAAEVESREAAIRRALERRIGFEFIETPLEDVVDFLEDKLKIEIQIYRKTLDDVGIGTDSPITLNLRDVPVRSGLELMLHELDLAWTIHNEVLLITTTDEARGMMRTKVYDVSDLPAFRDEQGRGVPDYESLIETITRTIVPESFDRVGGPGSIKEFAAKGIQALVITQSYDVHQQIAELLAQLRKVRGKELQQEDIAKLPPLPPPAPRAQPGQGGGFF